MEKIREKDNIFKVNESRKNMNKKIAVLLVIMVSLFITSQILLLNTSPNKWDSADYLKQIDSISEGKRKIFRPVSFQYLHELYFILGAVFFKIFDTFNFDVELTTLLMSILMGAFIPIFVYKLVNNIYPSKFFALSASFLTMFNPLILWYSNEIMTGIPTLFLITLALFLLSEFLVKHKNYLLIFASFILGVTLLLRFNSLFVFPAFLFLILIQQYSRKHKMINILVSTLCLFAPILIYIIYSIIFNDSNLINFFLITSQAKPSINNFNFRSIIILFGFLINSFTSFFIISLILGIFGVIILVKRKKIKIDYNFKIKFIFPIIWIVFFLIYSRFSPAYICQYTRHNLIIVPGFILLYIAVLYYLRPYLNRKIAFYKILFIAILLFAIDLTILLNSNFYKYYFLFKGNVVNFSKYFIIISFFVCLFYLIVKSVFKNYVMKKYKKMFEVTFILLFIYITSLLYTLPILFLNHTKINHEKAEALWFSKNTPKDALIISGHEYPFNIFYAKPRETVFIKRIGYNALRYKIDYYLQNNRSVFFSDNRYLKSGKLMQDKNYKFIKVGEIPKEILRNQYEHEFHYMNYYLMKQSKNIDVFKIERKIDVTPYGENWGSGHRLVWAEN